MTTAAGGLQLGQHVQTAVRALPPGCFAFVMATGIVSTALDRIGWGAASITLLVLAIVGGAVLIAAQFWRLIAYPRAVMADARNPAISFGFLTIVAAIDVVGVRLFTPDDATATLVLTLVSVPLWVLLVYAIPAILMLRSGTDSVLTSADGSWFLWVVATQSLAIAVGTLAAHDRIEALAAIATALWGIGVMLYLLLATLVTLRLLTAPNTAGSMNPSYWIYMGATAITVLAGSRLLTLPHGLPIVDVVLPVVSGLTFVFWAFGVWWVPLLIVFGFWRHVVRRIPLRYESGVWSIVFPLGMFSVASMHFGGAEHLGILAGIGSVGAVVALAAWLVAFVGMLVTASRAVSRRVPNAPGASSVSSYDASH